MAHQLKLQEVTKKAPSSSIAAFPEAVGISASFILNALFFKKSSVLFKPKSDSSKP